MKYFRRFGYYYLATALMLATALVAMPLRAQTIVVNNDDGAPAYTDSGSWHTGGFPGYDGGTYRWSGVGSASTATWTASLPLKGHYEVSVVYLAGTNRATAARYDIGTAGGVETAFVNQTQNSLQWVSVGTYRFEAGNNTITLDAGGSSGNNVVIADAVRFEYVETIVNNDDGAPYYTDSGSWITSGFPGYDGGTYRWASAGSSSTATWNASLGVRGRFEVSVIYVAGSNRATSTRYDIAAADGVHSVFVNQRQNNLEWVSLGVFDFDATGSAVSLNAGGSSGGNVVIADAVKFEYVETIVDDDDGFPDYSETGSWIVSSFPGYNGGIYRFTSTGGNASATWAADIPASGFYEVSVIYVAGSNRATSVRYDVSTAGGSRTSFVNQTQSNLTWVPLGTYELNVGVNTVTLDAEGSSGGSVVIADAVRFTPADEPPAGEGEIRLAPIVVFDQINSTSAIQAWVNEIASLNYNAVAVHTRYRGDATYFPNKVDSTFPNNEPRTSAAGSIDVLEEFVTRGHAAGLKVFAYVNTHLVTDGTNSHPNPNHVVNTNPQWRTYAWNNGNPVVQTTSHDGEGLWMDPALPGYRAYLANICGDIMMNYNADGIILDRIRYPQTAWTRTSKDFGYHPGAWADFQAIYGKSPHPNDADWITYRQDQITAAVDVIYDTITTIDPGNILLTYPLGRFNDALNFTYQNWPEWIDSGIVDAAILQVYASDDSLFESRLQQNLNAYSGQRILGVGSMAWQSGINVQGQMETVRSMGFKGHSPWRHGVMENLGYFPHVQSVFADPAPWPTMPWKD